MDSIILAGGHSTRLGRDKASLYLNGEPLLHRTIFRLEQLSNEIIIVLAPGQQVPVLPDSPRIRIVTDTLSGKGPLIGIYSALQASRDDRCLAVACDMPFLNVDLLRYMMGLSPEFDVVVPRVNSLPEPLHAIYSRRCLNILKEMIEQGDLKVVNLLGRTKVRYVEESEIDAYDPEHLSWFNINTPGDLEQAEMIFIAKITSKTTSPGNPK